MSWKYQNRVVIRTQACLHQRHGTHTSYPEAQVQWLKGQSDNPVLWANPNRMQMVPCPRPKRQSFMWKRPEKKCYNCCSTDNLKHQCSDLPSCYTCNGSGHMTRECSEIQHKTQFPSPEQHDDREEVVYDTLQRLGPPCLDSPERSNLDSCNYIR